MKATIISALVLKVITLLAAPGLTADPQVTGAYWPLQQGYAVQFAVYNALAEGNVRSLSVTTGDAADASGPSGWGIYQTFREIQWSTSAANGIPPGRALGGFAYVAEAAPGSVAWAVQGGGYGYYGTLTPLLIPEPSSLLALFAGIGAMGAGIRRRKP